VSKLCLYKFENDGLNLFHVIAFIGKSLHYNILIKGSINIYIGENKDKWIDAGVGRKISL